MKNIRFKGSLRGCLVLGALGVLSFCFAFYVGWNQACMNGWKKTTAIIVAFDDGVVLESEWQGEWYANPKIRYTYEVAGKSFESTAINPSPFNYQSRRRFATDTQGWHPGAATTCWYNPADPTEVYLINQGITIAPVLLGSLGILGVVPLILLKIQKRRSPSQ